MVRLSLQLCAEEWRKKKVPAFHSTVSNLNGRRTNYSIDRLNKFSSLVDIRIYSMTLPFVQQARVAGRYNTLVPFVVVSGNQESIGGSGNIALDCYHTKLFCTNSSASFRLNDGLQDGQVKKLQFVHKGRESLSATVGCKSILGGSTTIVFNNIGDYVLLIWTGTDWCVLETGNSTDPTLGSPQIE